MSEQWKKTDGSFEGIELLEKDDRGHERFLLPAGVYQADFGFRKFGDNEDKWRSQMSDNPSDHDKKFVFDHEHSAVSDFANSLFHGETNFSDPKQFIELVQAFQSKIHSTPISNQEYHRTLSEIVNAGQGMCDAQTTLFGSLLAHHTKMTAEAIHGQVGIIGNSLSYPFSHQWMRITCDHSPFIYLYDPMYRKLAVFESENDTIVEHGDSSRYFETMSPSCFAASHLYNRAPITSFAGVKPVERYTGDYHDLYADDEQRFYAQLTGTTSFAFELNVSYELKLNQRAIETSEGGETSVFYPLQNLHTNPN